MVRKKIDNRIRVLIENCVMSQHRSMFVIVGDQGKDQVVILHHMLSKALIKSRPSVLWCYKKELGFSSHRKKRMRQLQKKVRSGKMDLKEDDPFELFVSATNIRYCYYAETQKILGNTYGMCVLQDFEGLSPNLLARTIETVEGGGIIVLLLNSINSLKQLYTMTMDVHARFRTEAHQDVVGRFNERFILSLTSCDTCIVIDDQLNLLPISSSILDIKPLPAKSSDDPLKPSEQELVDLKSSLTDTQPVGSLINLCKTLDQAKAVLKFIEVISEKTLKSTVTLTAARGRGKSAAIGLSISCAIAFGYSNIFVTSPSPENLKTLFEFVFKGFDALEYQEHTDYEIIQSTNPEFNKAIVRVSVFKDHRQIIQYIHPSDSQKLGQAELLCIDEAAAIPLPLVRNLIGPYLVFMSSTINGYEGTGRSLSLKLVQQLRQQSSTFGGKQSVPDSTQDSAAASGRFLKEITLEESIRYAENDPVEKWLYELLCLDATTLTDDRSSSCPLPASCDLYYVNRDTLFSYHKASENFLQRLMSLYVASHYKNSPNDLQMLSDAPAHHIFVLLGPLNHEDKSLPEVLCVLQVALEGEISKSTIMYSLQKGKRASGDLIPWTISQQFQDNDFPSLSGVRIVRIAVHPDYQHMGYGSRALELLQQYYQGNIPNLSETIDQQPAAAADNLQAEEVDLLEETISPRKNLPPLFLKLSERAPERLDYVGVSFGLTSLLLRFWKKSGFTPVYLRQTPNELTGEHSCIMLKMLNTDESNSQSWLPEYWKDFRKRYLSLLSYQFRTFIPSFALNILHQESTSTKTADQSTLSCAELDGMISGHDLQRLEMYANNMVDYHLITDLLPLISRLFFLRRIDVQLSPIQSALLLGLGLQHKTVDTLATELTLPSSQLLGLFNRSIRKIHQSLRQIKEATIEAGLVKQKDINMLPTEQTLDQDLDEAAKEFSKNNSSLFTENELQRFAIRGTENEWEGALNPVPSSRNKLTNISIKSSIETKRKLEANNEKPKFKKKKKNKT